MDQKKVVLREVFEVVSEKKSVKTFPSKRPSKNHWKKEIAEQEDGQTSDVPFWELIPETENEKALNGARGRMNFEISEGITITLN